MEKLSYKTEVFEGPLDLLLFLINKHKLNINDIPIFELVEQYTDYVRQMQENDMELASEFLEMASRLIYIKTVSLLPVYEEGEKLKKELECELMEYRDCKILAQKLEKKGIGFDFLCKAPDKLSEDLTYTRTHEPTELFRAYISAVGRGKRRLPPPVECFRDIVAVKIISVSSKFSEIFSLLKGKRRASLRSFYDNAHTRSDMVAVFLAVLELIKSKKIRVDGEIGDMTVTAVTDEYYGEE